MPPVAAALRMASKLRFAGSGLQADAGVSHIVSSSLQSGVPMNMCTAAFADASSTRHCSAADEPLTRLGGGGADDCGAEHSSGADEHFTWLG